MCAKGLHQLCQEWQGVAGDHRLELGPTLGELVVLQLSICPSSCGLLEDARQLGFLAFFYSLSGYCIKTYRKKEIFLAS